MTGQLPDDFQEVSYFEEGGGIVHQKLANLKNLDEESQKADLVVYLPLGRRNLKGVEYGIGKPGCWCYPGEQPGSATAKKPATTPAAPAAAPITPDKK